ncbi:MAG: hypothetical protein JNN08_11210 [Bryobacterales bacterium]|nr:hypothetical protein [Bryobacterales bacterium]
MHTSLSVIANPLVSVRNRAGGPSIRRCDSDGPQLKLWQLLQFFGGLFIHASPDGLIGFTEGK